MAEIVESIEISRPPDEVFAYITDASRLPEWQESLVSARREDDAPPAVGSTVVMTRKVGGRERTMTMQQTEFDPPRSFAAAGVDGPVRAIVRGTVEPLADGTRSRVTISLDFKGHGIGRLLVPLVVRRQARAEMPRDQQKLKQQLESSQ